MIIISDLLGDVKDAYLGGVDDIVLGGLELPESVIDGDSSLTLSLQFVKNPCVLERSLRNKTEVPMMSGSSQATNPPCQTPGTPSRTSRLSSCQFHRSGRSCDCCWGCRTEMKGASGLVAL